MHTTRGTVWKNCSRLLQDLWLFIFDLRWCTLRLTWPVQVSTPSKRCYWCILKYLVYCKKLVPTEDRHSTLGIMSIYWKNGTSDTGSPQLITFKTTGVRKSVWKQPNISFLETSTHELESWATTKLSNHLWPTKIHNASKLELFPLSHSLENCSEIIYQYPTPNYNRNVRR